MEEARVPPRGPGRPRRPQAVRAAGGGGGSARGHMCVYLRVEEREKAGRKGAKQGEAGRRSQLLQKGSAKKEEGRKRRWKSSTFAEQYPLIYYFFLKSKKYKYSNIF